MKGNDRSLNIKKFDRILCVVFTILGFLFFFLAFMLFFIFLIDIEYTDRYNLPRLSYNPFINNQKEYLLYRFLIDSWLILLFWVQHLALSNNSFKNLMNNFTNYSVFERGLFTFTSDLLLVNLIFSWRPITELRLFSFKHEYKFMNNIFYSLMIFGILEFLCTIPFFIQTDLFGLKHMYKVMNSLKIEIPTQTKISIPWIYRLCRHPMQSGILMTIIFSSTDYHFGRLFLICLFTLGVWLGINQEEKLLSREDEYMKYKLMVNNKLVPEITKIFK